MTLCGRRVDSARSTRRSGGQPLSHQRLITKIRKSSFQKARAVHDGMTREDRCRLVIDCSSFPYVDYLGLTTLKTVGEIISFYSSQVSIIDFVRSSIGCDQNSSARKEKKASYSLLCLPCRMLRHHNVFPFRLNAAFIAKFLEFFSQSHVVATVTVGWFLMETNHNAFSLS